MRKVSALAMAMLAAAACTDSAGPDALGTTGAAMARAPHGAGQLVQIVAEGHTLTAPAQVPSGWTTVQLLNRSGRAHFAVFERMPAGKTIADSRAEVLPVFQDAMDLINAGDPAAGFAEFARLPAWFSQVVFYGGPGLVAADGVAQTTLYLTPGRYVVECYVKSNGRFHSADGMMTEILVTNEAGGGREPRASAHVDVTNGGFALSGQLRPGLQTIRVDFMQQMIHENVLGTDVHLVRLENDTDHAALEQWMNWVEVPGLDTPAPAEFIGGTHEMPAGSTAYLTVHLTPGRYAFVAEVPNARAKGLWREFTVPGS